MEEERKYEMQHIYAFVIVMNNTRKKKKTTLHMHKTSKAIAFGREIEVRIFLY
jgi:hypothetical protein